MSLLQFSLSFNQLKKSSFSLLVLLSTTGILLTGCVDTVSPDPRTPNVPTPKVADQRERAINENAESIMYLPLGDDVLIPQSVKSDGLPDTVVGPYELRGETLAGALQLILDGVDIPVAFESDTSLTKTITVTNLKGPISQVVNDVCALANMYCSYNGHVLSVKDREIFTVTLPPIVAKADIGALLTNVAAAIGSITGETPITDPSTRTIVYRASQRTAEMANRYFQRLRSNTAMIVYETYIWEVNLNTANSTGIKWSSFDQIGRFKFGLNLAGSTDSNLGTPVSIGLPTTGNVSFTSGDVLQFISSYGAVKTISQPQISVLSGSEAKLRVADKQNYVASVTKTASTTTGGSDSFSTTTATADTGFTLNIGSNWDNSSVYGTIGILLQELRKIDTFEAGPDATVQLPQTTERELNTTVRIRPGDMVLIAGLVRESDQFTKDGLGLSNPLIPTSRSVSSGNTELVFLLHPRVIVFTAADARTPRNGDTASVSSPASKTLSKSDRDSSPSIPSPVLSPVVSPSREADMVAKMPAATAPVLADETDALSPVSSSIEIQPLPEVTTGHTNAADLEKDPSVIVNYDVLGH